MRPIFTIHAGEFLVGEYLERTFKNVQIWVPAKDTGIDLLVTNSRNTKAVSFQVKFSRDFLTTYMDTIFQQPMRACGWFTLNRVKIANSSADFWVFVLIGSKKRSHDFVVLRPGDLLKRLDIIHGEQRTIQSYIWVTERERCWETRGLLREERLQIAQNSFRNPDRDFTTYLNKCLLGLPIFTLGRPDIPAPSLDTQSG
jgi:hypothetical protein